MSSVPAHPVLRLVNVDEAPSPRMLPVRHVGGGPDAHARVRNENVSAATTMAALDPRWILAVQAKRALEGGRAAIIRPEERRRLSLVGERLGLRAFDTSLVIAVVQDGARAGEDPLGRDVVARLNLLAKEPELADAKRGPTWSMLLATAVVSILSGATIAACLLLTR